MAEKKRFFELFLISFAALFLELTIIRWLSTEVRIFAYFKNLPLMAAFLGFAVGCFFQRRADSWFYEWFPRIFLCLVAVIALAPFLGITHVIFVDPRQYFLLGPGLGSHSTNSAPSLYQTVKALLVIVGVFFLVVGVFSTLCTKLGELLDGMRPLIGYSINVVGSLFGVAAFSAASFWEWPPTLWLMIFYVLLFYFHVGRRSFELVSLYFLIAGVIVLHMGTLHPALWSPYYKVTVEDMRFGSVPLFHLFVNYDGFQLIQSSSPKYTDGLSENGRRAYNRHYDIPFRLSKRPIESVLILGGGAGNDAAVAIKNGARAVDVVEIDPVIARLGKELHPDKPYESPAVNLFIDDARSFLQRSTKTYDLVIFGTLDSHAAFSSLSSIRMDNFVFTRESLDQVAKRVNSDGGIALNFFAVNPWLSQRQFNTLKEAMGREPKAFGSKRMQETILLAGDLFDSARDLGETEYQPLTLPFTAKPVEPSTDDWPFLFLEKRGIPFHYLLPLFLILILALVPFYRYRSQAESLNWHLFLMGAAFLLIETKAVTTLGLILGSTWMLNSIVIGSILVMILLANLLASAFSGLSFAALYAALSSVLILNYFFPWDMLNQFDWAYRVGVGGLIVACPLFVAALIFAKAFAQAVSPSAALASNLLGSLVGGLLEYLDMWTGLRWLNIIALLLYLLSFLLLVRSKPTVTGGTAT